MIRLYNLPEYDVLSSAIVLKVRFETVKIDARIRIPVWLSLALKRVGFFV